MGGGIAGGIGSGLRPVSSTGSLGAELESGLGTSSDLWGPQPAAGTSVSLPPVAPSTLHHHEQPHQQQMQQQMLRRRSSRPSTPPPPGLRRAPLLPGIFHLVPHAWLRAWRLSLRDAAAPPPPALDCTVLLCEAHGMLLPPPHVAEYLSGSRPKLLAGLGSYQGLKVGCGCGFFIWDFYLDGSTLGCIHFALLCLAFPCCSSQAYLLPSFLSSVCPHSPPFCPSTRLTAPGMPNAKQRNTMQ